MFRNWLQTLTLLVLIAASTTAQPTPLAQTAPPLALLTDPETIEDRVASLTDSQRDNLTRQRERFDTLSKEEQTRLRAFHERLTSDARADRLFQIMEKYRDWLASLSNEKRAEILDLPPEERITRIRELMVKQNQKWLREFGCNLKEEDVRALSQFVQTYTKRHHKELAESVPEFFRGRINRIRSRSVRSIMLLSAAMRSKKDIPQPDPDEIKHLTDQLSPEAREVLASSTEPGAQFERIQEWLRIVSMRPDRLAAIPVQELEEYYLNELNADDRDELKQLSPEAMQSRLKKLYIMDQMGSSFGRGRGRRGRSGDRRPQFDRDRNAPPPGPPGPPPEGPPEFPPQCE